MLLIALIIAVAYFLPTAINPRIYWKLIRWQYKNPEANEPSATAFTVQRTIAIIALLTLVPLLFTNWMREYSRRQQAVEQREQRWADTARREQERLEEEWRRPRTMALPSDHDRSKILGYWALPSAKKLVVVYLPAECSKLLHAAAKEAREVITVNLVEQTTLANRQQACPTPTPAYQAETAVLKLEKPFRDREVRVPAPPRPRTVTRVCIDATKTKTGICGASARASSRTMRASISRTRVGLGAHRNGWTVASNAGAQGRFQNFMVAPVERSLGAEVVASDGHRRI
ncbi:hypothetical protein ACFQYP_13260 [Nonomuraea antimicrobica]